VFLFHGTTDASAFTKDWIGLVSLVRMKRTLKRVFQNDNEKKKLTDIGLAGFSKNVG
jgi:hypothetical protein